MATLNKYKNKIGLKSLFRTLRRHWVVFKLRLFRLPDIGRASSAVKDIAGFFGMVISTLFGMVKSLVSMCWRVFSRTAGRLLVFLEPVTELLADFRPRIRYHMLKLRSHHGERTRLMPVLFLAAVTVCIYTCSFLGIALKVEINGTPVGYVSGREEMEEILADVQDKFSEYLGTPYSLDLDVTYSIGYDDGSHAIDREHISNYVMSTLGSVSAKYALTVDGEVVGINKSKTALELLTQRMLELNATSYKGGKMEFVQDVKVVPQGMIEASETSIDDIQAKLTGNTKESVVYTVQAGDTVSGIAHKYSTSVAAIKSVNPGLSDNIHIGDKITISASVPMLSVKETVTEKYVKRIGYETEKRTTDALYTTQSRVVKTGEYGEANVTADVVYIDGREESRVIMDWQVAKEPVNEIIEVGTKKPPAKSATGQFRRPSNGVFTSGYGYRRSLGDFHTGVDFAGPVGTPIYASDGGKVTFASRKGNYGKCIFIDHGNGYVTLYAHCSQLLVKPGQRVAKGEQIAKVGATGRVTGPHLHFEIRKNGHTVNPLNYISK